jgi:mannose-6-phosphate isomerase
MLDSLRATRQWAAESLAMRRALFPWVAPAKPRAAQPYCHLPTVKLPTAMKIVPKPWGRELWIAHTDKYAMKIIEIKKGTRCSLQYHIKKHEHIYVDSGMMGLEWENEKGEIENLVLAPGEVVENKPGRKHRMTAIEDLRLIEVSTPELDDVVRLADDFQREGTSTP